MGLNPDYLFKFFLLYHNESMDQKFRIISCVVFNGVDQNRAQISERAM